MSNFAAKPTPNSGLLSPPDESTSEIIDAFSNSKYAFSNVYVKFGICFPLDFFNLQSDSWISGCVSCGPI